MNDDSIRWYKSKVDWWIALVLCVPPTVSLIVVVALFWDGKHSEIPAAIGAILLVCGIYVGLIFPMRYGLDNHQLVVRFGLCRQRIPLDNILEVRPTRNPLSSPALSLDRLHVQFGKGFFKAVMISPADRQKFLTDLATNAGLQQTGEQLFKLQ